MNNAQAELDKLISELNLLSFGDLKAAYAIKQRTVIFVRKVIGEKSPHLNVLGQIQFTPTDIIYNKVNAQNEFIWNNGVNNLQATLDSIKYEIGLIVPKLLPPQEMTLSWLANNVPAKMWYLFLLMIISAFTAGAWLEKHFKISP